MINEKITNIIIDILKKSAIAFRDQFNKNLKIKFFEEQKEDEIVVHFNIWFDRHLEYLLIFKKQKSVAEYLEKLEKDIQLDSTTNPYKDLKFTDESTMLSNIYDLIQILGFDEIACYKDFGILLTNPFGLDGIYNIAIKYISD